MNKWIKKDSFYFVDCRLLFNNVEEQLKKHLSFVQNSNQA